MKKFTALVLALTLILSLGTTALALSPSDETIIEQAIDLLVEGKSSEADALIMQRVVQLNAEGDREATQAFMDAYKAAKTAAEDEIAAAKAAAEEAARKAAEEDAQHQEISDAIVYEYHIDGVANSVVNVPQFSYYSVAPNKTVTDDIYHAIDRNSTVTVSNRSNEPGNLTVMLYVYERMEDGNLEHRLNGYYMGDGTMEYTTDGENYFDMGGVALEVGESATIQIPYDWSDSFYADYFDGMDIVYVLQSTLWFYDGGGWYRSACIKPDEAAVAKMRAEQQTAQTFTDVSSNDYFATPVAWALENGITSGTSKTTFSPNMTCSNAHILTFLWNAAGSPVVETDNTFTDVAKDDYYYQAALWAKSKGMVSGSALAPNAPCNRASTVKFIWQAAGSPTVTSKTNFTDVPADADYVMAVAWALENGITSGTSKTTFSPNTTCTRAQIVTFLYNAFAQ